MEQWDWKSLGAWDPGISIQPYIAYNWTGTWKKNKGLLCL